MTDTFDIVCDGPGPHDPEDGVLGTADREVDGMRCQSPACAQSPAAPAPEADGVLDAATVEQIKTQLAKATTIAGVKTALGPLLDALG